MVSNNGFVKMQKTNKQARKASELAQKPAYKGKQWHRTDKRQQQKES